MTDRYVRSGATGGATGGDWTNAKVTIAAGAAVAGAGDRIFVSEDHAESQATAMTITFPGTAANPNHVICVNHSGSVPPVAADLRTTATCSVGAGNVAMIINGSAEIYGITFNGGTSTGTSALIRLAETNGNRQIYKNCAFALRNGSATYIASGGITVGTTCSELILENTTVTFGTSASQVISVNNSFIWRNTASAVSWGTMPNTLFAGTAGRYSYITLEGVDLNNFTGTINGTGAILGRFLIKDCRLHASATYAVAVGTSFPTPLCELVRSDSGNTNYKLARKTFEGDIIIDTTTVRTGGATDGTTPISWKIVTTANSGFAFPFVCPPIRIWNEVVSGTIDVTMYGAGAAIPYDDEFVFEAEVLDNASYPIASKVTSEMVLLATHAAFDTDSASTWGGAPATKWSKTLTLSPRQKGYIYIYAKAMKASTTFYIDPKPIVTGGPYISRSSLGENELFAGISRARVGIGM